VTAGEGEHHHAPPTWARGGVCSIFPFNITWSSRGRLLRVRATIEIDRSEKPACLLTFFT